MVVCNDSLSVLVVDEEPDILSFFARILDTNGMRALLARSADEAIGIVKRGYVPIDLVLTDVSLKRNAAAADFSAGPQLVDRLREFRPELRGLYMSAHLDSEVIRIELMDCKLQTMSKNPDDEGLIESIRTAATAPLTRRMGSTRHQ